MLNRRQRTWRLVWFRLAVLVLLLVVSIGGAWWQFGPSRADQFAEQRLLGKWGMWTAGSDLTLPPERIIEWLPGGETIFYSPGEVPPSARSQANDDVRSDWYIRNGSLYSVLKTSQGSSIVEFKMTWQGDDRLIMTTGEPGHGPLQIIYQRMEPTGAEAPQHRHDRPSAPEGPAGPG